jgi:hypothetical protein
MNVIMHDRAPAYNVGEIKFASSSWLKFCSTAYCLYSERTQAPQSKLASPGASIKILYSYMHPPHGFSS